MYILLNVMKTRLLERVMYDVLYSQMYILLYEHQFSELNYELHS